MSDSSRDYDSSGSLKGLKKRLQTRQGSDTVKRSLNHFSDIKKNMEGALQSMFSGKSDSSVYSKGVRELDDFGYEKYNLEDDGGEIFISKVPEKALFNDGEPIMVRATAGNFVGSVDNTSVHFDVGEAQSKAEDVRNLFINVPRGTAVETEYHATVGEVTADGTVKPRPIDNSFMDRLRSPTPVDRHTIQDVEVDNVSQAPDVEVAPTFLQIDDDEEAPVEVPGTVEEAVQAPVEEAPVAEVAEAVEENRYSFLDRVSGAHSRPKAQEFFVDEVTDEPVEAPVEEAEEDEYSWISFGDDVPQEDMPVAEIPVIDAPVEEPVEAPVEIPVIDAPVMEAAVVEVPMDAPAEIPMESPVEVPAEEPADVYAESVIEEAPVEPVAVMTLPGAVDVEPIEKIEGVEMEGSEPSVGSSAADDIPVAKEPEMAPTSSVSTTHSSLRIGLEEDGEALPPLSDPVVKRPRTVRFRFSNGVLQNVNDTKEEPKEELHSPLD